MIRASVGRGIALAAFAVTLPTVAQAQSEERLGANVSLTAGYANNPFAILDEDTGSALVSLDIAPYYQVRTERSTLTLSANANLQQYLRRYGRNESYSGAVDYQKRVSEKLNAHVRADISSSVLGANNGLSGSGFGLGGIGTGIGAGTAGVVGGVTGAGPGIAGPGVAVLPVAGLTPLTDIGLFGLRNRRNLGRVSGDVGYGLTERDTLTLSGYAEVTRFDGLIVGDFEAYSGSLGYSRRVSDQVNLGLRGSASTFDYRTSNADSRIYSIEATGSARLNALWSVDGALGVTFVDSDSDASTSSTSLSGSINLCRRGERSNMCLQGARQVSPTGLAGSQYVTSAGLNWSRQIDERENVSLGANYSKVGGGGTQLITGGPALGVLPLQTEFVGVVAGYDRQLRERLRLVASVNYRQLLGDGNAGRPKDYGGQIGLSYRFGR